jgi:hypothetical protein
MAVSFKTAGAGLRCDGTVKSPDIGQAVQFLAANARVVDRRSYERLFEGGGAQPVRDAVAAYRNPDGGFGQALEPDGRAPASQSAAVELALRILHETDVWDEDLVAGACGWLEATAPAEGGVVFVDASVDRWPHAPWWVPEPGPPASLSMTGLIAGTLHARQVRQPWLDRATEVMWDRIGQITTPTGYGMLGVLRFLQYVPDRDRATAVFGQIVPLITDSGIVTLDPGAPGEVHTPLDFAPEPDSMGRALFSEATIKAHLDHLAHAQLADGGWTFNWPAWSPCAERDWRGYLTVDALRLLRANTYLL